MFTKPIRTWVIIAQVLGTILSVAALVAYASLFGEATSSMTGSDIDASEANTISALISAIISYAIVKSIINAVVIINACNKMDDLELSANRWIISSLSLTVGGFFTPFVMKMFPNVNIRSTIKPKVFLSRVYGWTLTIGAAVFMVVFGAVAQNDLVANDVTKQLTEAFYVINGIFFILGIVLLALFSRKDAYTAYDNNTAMKVFANFVAGIITVELVIMLVWNWIEILGSITEAFNGNNRNPAFILFQLINVVLSVIYIGFLTQITCETISGIWKNQADYKVFQPLQDRQNDTTTTTL